MLTEERLLPAFALLFADLPKPVRVLSVRATRRAVVAQVQNAADLTKVDEYRCKPAGCTGPVQVRLMGKGKLRDNLFPLRAIDLSRSPEVMVRVSQEHELPIEKLIVTRNLPQSMDIQFRVHLQSADRELIVAVDKNGRILGPIPAAVAPSP